MGELDPQKKLRIAMNGKMCLMCAGIFLIFTAVTSTIMYGFNMFAIASEAAKGNEEYLEVLKTVDISITMLRVCAALFIVLAALEIFVGVCSVRFSNRVDKAYTMRKLVIALLVIEVVMEVYLFFIKMMSVGMLFTSLVMPLFMLWGVTRFIKLIKDDPTRVYAVETKKSKEKTSYQYSKPKEEGGKSLRERAMMKATEQPTYSLKELNNHQPADPAAEEEKPADTDTDSENTQE